MRTSYIPNIIDEVFTIKPMKVTLGDAPNNGAFEIGYKDKKSFIYEFQLTSENIGVIMRSLMMAAENKD